MSYLSTYLPTLPTYAYTLYCLYLATTNTYTFHVTRHSMLAEWDRIDGRDAHPCANRVDAPECMNLQELVNPMNTYLACFGLGRVVLGG